MKHGFGFHLWRLARGHGLAIVAALAVVVAHRMSGMRSLGQYEPFTAEERRAGLDRVIPEVVLEDATFGRAIEVLEMKVGARISIEPGDEARQGGMTWESLAPGRVTLRLRDVTLAQALGIMSFLYLPESEAEFVVTPVGQIELRYWPELVTRRYDVRDIIAAALVNPELHDLLVRADERAPEIFGASPPAPGLIKPLPPHVRAGQGLVDQIIYGTDTAHWKDTGGHKGEISYSAGELVVAHTRAYQLKVEVLLERFRGMVVRPLE